MALDTSGLTPVGDAPPSPDPGISINAPAPPDTSAPVPALDTSRLTPVAPPLDTSKLTAVTPGVTGPVTTGAPSPSSSVPPMGPQTGNSPPSSAAATPSTGAALVQFGLAPLEAVESVRHGIYKGIDEAVAGILPLAQDVGDRLGFTPPDIGITALQKKLEAETTSDAPQMPPTGVNKVGEAVGKFLPAFAGAAVAVPYFALQGAGAAKQRQETEAPNATQDQIDQNVGLNSMVNGALGILPGLGVAKSLGLEAMQGISGYAARTLLTGGAAFTLANIVQAVQNGIDHYTTNPAKVLTEGVPSAGNETALAAMILHGMVDRPISKNPTENPFGAEPAPPGTPQLPAPPAPSPGEGPSAPDISQFLPGGPDTVIRNPPPESITPAPPAPSPTRVDLADMLNSPKTAEQLAAEQASGTAVPAPPAPPLDTTGLTPVAPADLTPPAISPLQKQMQQLSADGLLNIINTSKNRRMIDAATAEYTSRFPDHAEGDFKAGEIEQAAQTVAPNPTDAQKEAGNYQKGHVWINGLDVSIENPRGSERNGIGPDGKPWSVTMPDHYGYVKKTEGADGDQMDVYIAEGPPRKYAYVIDQIDPHTGLFDEHKAMLNYPTQDAAISAYTKAFSDGLGTARLGGITEMPMPKFKEWLKSGDTSKPLAYRPALPSADEKSQSTNSEVSAHQSEFEPSPGSTTPMSSTSPFTKPTTYQVGKKSIDLLFQSDVDRAMYHLATSPQAKPDNPYLNFLFSQGYSQWEIAEYHQRVALEAEKLAKGAPKGSFSVNIPPISPHPSHEKVVEEPVFAASQPENKPNEVQEAHTAAPIPENTLSPPPSSPEKPPEQVKEAASPSEKTLEQPKTPPEPENKESNTPAAAAEAAAAPAPRKSRLESVGEEMAGKRSQLLADLEKQPDAVKFAKAVMKATERAKVFPILVQDDATSGTHYYANIIRDSIKTFFDHMKSNSFSYRRSNTIEKNIQNHYEENANKLSNLAAEYAETLGTLSRIFSDVKTVSEARTALQEALIEPNSDLSKFGKHDSSDATTMLTPLGLKVNSLLEKDMHRRSYNDPYNISRWFLSDHFPASIADTDEMKERKRPEKVMRRPPLETIVRDNLGDWRNGKDITPSDFKNAFNFRGVEIGEWVNAAEGQAHINHAYDALHDLAKFLKADPTHLSLGGKLGFAFGSRGRGDASAHFEPDNMVINVTKTRGDGSVAHEWLHALDHVLLKKGGHSALAVNWVRKALKHSLYDTDYYRQQVKTMLRGHSFYEGMKKQGPLANAEFYLKQLEHGGSHYLNQTNFFRNAQALGKDYWGNDAEILARSWEAFVFDTLGGASPYLVSDWAADGNVTKEGGYRGDPYPSGEERASFNENYGDFIKALEWTTDGVSVSTDYNGPAQSSKEKRHAIVAELRDQLKDLMREVRDENAKNRVPGNAAPPDGGTQSGPAPGAENQIGQAGGISGGENGRGGSDLQGGAGKSGTEAPAEGQPGVGRGSDGSDDRADTTIPAAGTEYKPEDIAALIAADISGNNYVIKPGALKEGRGQKQKARDNIDAIKLLKKIEQEGRAATLEEQASLALYAGWGGIKNAFADVDGNFRQEWKEVGTELREILTPEEYRIARKTIQYAHYTSEVVVRAMWDALEKMGFKTGSIFEPGMGVGNFPGMMPRKIAKKSTYSGIELDPMTARMARLLYPEYTVRNADLIATPLGANVFDVVIGNPPFSDVKVRSDPRYESEAFPLHDYFFAKSMDALAPGGILAFITSHYSLDRIDPTAREWLAKKADLLGAVRLPNTAFKTNANTDVVTDIIFLRKRKIDEESKANPDWLKTSEITLKNDKGEEGKAVVNKYFADHPEMIVGDQSLAGSMYRENEYTVGPSKDFDFEKALAEAMNNLPQGIWQGADKVDTAEIDALPPEKKEGSFYLKDDKLFQVDPVGLGRPVPLRGSGIGGVTKGDYDKIKAIVPIRNALRSTLLAMREHDLGPIARAQVALTKSYDAFVAKYGPLNKVEYQVRRPSPAALEEARSESRDAAGYLGDDFDEGEADLTQMSRERTPEGKKKFTNTDIANERQRLRDLAVSEGRTFNEGSFNPDMVEDDITEKYPNLDAFRSDPEVYALMILEDYDIETQAATKKEIFTQNILAKPKVPDIRTPVDALHYSLNVKNDIDPDFMASHLQMKTADVLDDLVKNNQIYLDPSSLIDSGDNWRTTDDYLSGNVKTKLKEAKDASRKDDRFNRNVKALEEVQPKDIPVSDIGIGLGAPYIPSKAINDFSDEELNIIADVNFYPSTNTWTVSSSERRSAESSFKYGTQRISAVDILNNLLNKKEIVVYDYFEVEGKKTAKVNPTETEAAQEKARLIAEKFENWIWKSKYGSEIHRYYNDNFNNIVPRKFDGSHLTPAISPSIKLLKHQLDVTWRVIQQGNTYIAHAVGAGKTLEMVVSGMEMKRLGLVKKPMYVVPNHMLGQFSMEFRQAYPDAKIYVADEHRFHTTRRKLFVAQVAKNDWDAVIITYSAFGKIPISPELETGLLQREIMRYLITISDMKKNGDSRTLSQIEKAKQKIEERIKALKTKGKDQAFSFEDLGVDFLFADEAHYFRKLSFTTRQGRVRGVDPAGSKMAWDLYAKTRHLEDIKPGRNLVLASGTPITNTLGEAFTIQRFMDEKTLDSLNINSFDSWSAVYATTRTKLEKQPSGNYAQVTRFARFQNLPSLSTMVRNFMDVVTSSELGRLVNRPVLNTGQVQIRTTKPSESFLDYQKVLERRMEAIKARSGKVQKGDDIILSVINDGRHAAIDMRLIDPTLPADQRSKLNDMIDQVHRIWEATKNNEYRDKKGHKETLKGATQLIFSDLGVKKREKNGVTFSAYEWIKQKLIQMGVPPKEIAFMRDYESHEDKRRLILEVNQGKVRVLIGATSNMGTGVNAQKRLKAIHNLDAPWFPADLEQRIGRGLRQGNQNKEIDAFGYGTEGSYDATMWSLLETKSSFINAFLNGTNTLPEADDITDTDMYRIAEALVTGDPKVLRRAELMDEISRLERKYKAYQNEQAHGRFQITSNINAIEFRKEKIKGLEAAIKERIPTDGDKFKATVNGMIFNERKSAGEALINHVDKLMKSNRQIPDAGIRIGDMAGFPIIYSFNRNSFTGEFHQLTLDTPLNDDYSASWGKDAPNPLGVIRSLENAPTKFEKYIAEYKANIEQRERDNKIIESSQITTFPKQEEFDEKKKELAQIEAELQKKSDKQVVDQTPPASDAANEMAIIGDTVRLSIAKPMERRGEPPAAKKVGLILKRTSALTPEQQQMVSLVHSEIRHLAPEATPRLFASIEGDVDSPDKGLLVIHGAYFKSFGSVSHVIAWSLDNTTKGAIDTVRHEAIHYFRRSGLITRPEWGVLEKTALDRDWLGKHEITARYPDFDHEIRLEEAVADEFADWSRKVEDRFGNLPARVQRTFRKMDLFRRRLMAGIRDVLGKEPTAQDIFTKMQTGEVGAREPERGSSSPAPDTSPLLQRAKKPQVDNSTYEERLAKLQRELKGSKTPADYIGELTSKIGNKLPEKVRDIFESTSREAMMGANPMSEGSSEARAMAKDYSNSVRLADWKYAEMFKSLTDNFKPGQLKVMWEKMDETSVWAQKEQAKSAQPLTFADLAEKAEQAKVGIYSMPRSERDTLLAMNKAAQALYGQAQDNDMVEGDGIPFWTPRMAVLIGEDGSFQNPGSGNTKPNLDAKGLNFSTYSPNLKQRKHLEAGDTEAAMKEKLGDEAMLVKDIRAMALAMRRLERAVAGRAFINQIKAVSNRVGYLTVRDTPAEGFFTLDHPAFKGYRPRLEKQPDGKWKHVKDENGQPLFDQYPIYVSKQFEGPLRAILSSRAPLWYRALMQIKMKTIGLIMYSPLMHNMVEFGRAMPALPGKVLTGKVYFEGNAARRGITYTGIIDHLKGNNADNKLPEHPMIEAIKNGMVPIAGRGFKQDVTSLVEEPSLNAGQSLTAKALGGVSDAMMGALFGRARGVESGKAVKEFIDKTGDFYHNTLLWNRVADLQMGLYINLRDQLVADGYDRQTAGRMAAHLANRYAGVLPVEAMSEASRRLANVMMFSRTFTLGNLGVMKDILTGLPSDVSSQITRDAGEDVAKAAKSRMAKKSFQIFALDIAMLRVQNMLLAGALAMLLLDQDLDDVIKGYVERWHDLVAHLEKNPLDIIPEIISVAESIDPTFSNEPGKTNRIMFDTDDRGTAYYLKAPLGRIGEEFVKWLTDPRNTFMSKVAAFPKSVMEVIENEDHFKNHIYPENTHGFLPAVTNVGLAIAHIVGAQESFTDIFKGAANLYQDVKTGTGSVLADSVKTLGPLFGVTVSKGFPGGPAAGEQHSVLEARNDAIEAARPQFRDLIQRATRIDDDGHVVVVDKAKLDEAQKMMEGLGMTRGDIKHTMKIYEVPESRMSKSATQKFESAATPEQKDRFDRALAKQ